MNTAHAAALRVALAFGLGTCALVVACSSSTTPAPATLSFSSAAAVAGAADTHCAGKIVEVSQAACHVTTPAADADTADADSDGGASTTSDYGPTQPGSEGEDDDCKYHVKWQSTAVAENADVTFQIVATVRKDNSPLAGATPYAEIFLNDMHPAPNTKVATTETTPGTYTIGPVRFDAAGNWNVRFHFNDQCTDSEESPHGHAAFFVKVP